MVQVTIRLVATDLDGTLLNSERAISPRSAAAMTAAADAGIIVVWATARAKHSVHSSPLRAGSAVSRWQQTARS